jgi:hypothetical protein
MKIRQILSMCVALGVCNIATSASSCFDDLDQHYEYDDGGFAWSQRPGICTDEKSIPPSSRINGGSIDVRVSGDNAVVTEIQYDWSPPSHSAMATSCPHSIRNESKRTRIMTGGVVYETTVETDAPTRTSQRPARPNELLFVSRVQRGVNPGPQVDDLGQDTIAGHTCRRLSPKGTVDGVAHAFEICILLNGPDCRKADFYILPLELTQKSPGGGILFHGKTTILRYGGLGTVVQPGSIHAP